MPRTTAVLALALVSCAAPPRATPPERRSAELAAFFEEAFEAHLDRHPMSRGYLGDDTDNHRWNDPSAAAAEADAAAIEADLAELRERFDPDDLGPTDRLSYRLFEADAERRLAAIEWRAWGYPVSHYGGWHLRVPTFLANIHRVGDVADAEAYVQRLVGVGPLFDAVIDELTARAERGVVLPAWGFPMVIGDCRRVAEGTILDDFREKVGALGGLGEPRRAALIAAGERAHRDVVVPAYGRLVATLEDLAEEAPEGDGVWRLPAGGEYYAHRLRRMTTTDLDSYEIHHLGLRQVARIHDEMRAIMTRVGHDGDLASFFEVMRTDPRFYLANDEAGRAEYLQRTREVVDAMKARLPDLFRTLPKADMEVRAVEAYREETAGKAFYQRGAPDGSRPGVYYTNLHRMEELPTWQLESLAYHEGVPGHHMQLSIAQELEGLPRFRRFGGVSAYVEGWALYCERMPREHGFYADPYSDFGRLAAELWRACRLVVDTGIHANRWSKERAIRYLVENTPNPEGDCVRAIERYVVMPGQATAYMVGMLRILELRERARERLGGRFDLRAFHDVVLTNGSLPLDVLEEVVDAWIERAAARATST